MLRYLTLNRFLRFSDSVDPFVKTFIIADSLLYSSINFVTPFFALFLIENVIGGNIQVAASMISLHFLARILSEIVLGRFINSLNEINKVLVIVLGLILISISYVAFGYIQTIDLLYILWVISGIGWGISTPTKLSLFSVHLDKKKEAIEWGAADVLNLSFIALATVIGGFIANNYGFALLFFTAALLSFIGIVPYFIYLRLIKET